MWTDYRFRIIEHTIGIPAFLLPGDYVYYGPVGDQGNIISIKNTLLWHVSLLLLLLISCPVHYTDAIQRVNTAGYRIHLEQSFENCL